jgi:malate dehydrogenase (oxaloacetate-decarboxylating)
MGFPAIFRGTLDVKAKTITDEMCIAAAYELAKCAEDRGISEEYISPTMADWEAFVREAVAVGMKAIEQGVAREKLSREELTQRVEKKIRESREATALLMESGLIPPPPEG